MGGGVQYHNFGRSISTRSENNIYNVYSGKTKEVAIVSIAKKSPFTQTNTPRRWRSGLERSPRKRKVDVRKFVALHRQ